MIILWHYRDLRLKDHPALTYASQTNQQIIPLYIHDPAAENPWQSRGASNWWLHHSLDSLQKQYRECGSELIIHSGDSQEILEKLLQELSIKEVCWTERYQPALRQRDARIEKWLSGKGVAVTRHPGNYLIDPASLLNQSGKPYVVFTPFYKAICKDTNFGKLLPVPQLKPVKRFTSLPLEALHLLPKVPWDNEIRRQWKPGREGAEEHLRNFVQHDLADYALKRDFPAENATSRLSPYLAFGEISSREIWQRCIGNSKSEPYLRQLVWREFANYFLYHFPHSTDSPWRMEFEKFPWKHDLGHLSCWQQGLTGFPIVDAGMRELWQTGWMHNRVRMIVASFLVKDLMIHWLEGARWFWDTLVDFDLGNNTLGWQWVAGSGPDAAPYFRIFNPVLQGQKFDPEGAYVKKYVPELAKLPGRWIHCPWEAPPLLLKGAGITLGKTYPEPIVIHETARKGALATYHAIRSIPK